MLVAPGSVKSNFGKRHLASFDMPEGETLALPLTLVKS